MISPRRARLNALLREIDHNEVQLITGYIDHVCREMVKAREELQFVRWERDEARWRVRQVSEENLSGKRRIQALEMQVQDKNKDLACAEAQLRSSAKRPPATHRPYEHSLSSVPNSRKPLSTPANP